jgi:hypothetical protein
VQVSDKKRRIELETQVVPMEIMLPLGQVSERTLEPEELEALGLEAPALEVKAPEEKQIILEEPVHYADPVLEAKARCADASTETDVAIDAIIEAAHLYMLYEKNLLPALLQEFGLDEKKVIKCPRAKCREGRCTGRFSIDCVRL